MAGRAPTTTEDVTSAPLLSAAFFVGEACAAQNEAFVTCKSASRDPAACQTQGAAVTACAVALYVCVRASCMRACVCVCAGAGCVRVPLSLSPVLCAEPYGWLAAAER
jgi:hypothetical protein